MKTISLHFFRGLRVAAILNILASAVSVQAAPGTAGHQCYGEVTTLPDIPGAVDVVVSDSNNHGQVIGIYFDADFNAYGFGYAHGDYTSLDLLPSRINDRGQIVGSTFDSNFDVRSFIYEKGVYTDINIPGAQITYAYGINDRGQITGTYYDSDSQPHGFVLNQ